MGATSTARVFIALQHSVPLPSLPMRQNTRRTAKLTGIPSFVMHLLCVTRVEPRRDGEGALHNCRRWHCKTTCDVPWRRQAMTTLRFELESKSLLRKFCFLENTALPKELPNEASAPRGTLPASAECEVAFAVGSCGGSACLLSYRFIRAALADLASLTKQTVLDVSSCGLL